jgi:hypothetical protein
MSYCRFSEGDVYMYHHVGGFVECCSCSLADLVDGSTAFFDQLSGADKKPDYEGPTTFKMHGNTNLSSYREALEHLQKHRDAGHSVPEDAFDRLREDIESGGSPEASICDRCGGPVSLGCADFKSGEFLCENCGFGKKE